MAVLAGQAGERFVALAAFAVPALKGRGYRGGGLLLVAGAALLAAAFVVWIDRRPEGPTAGRDLAVVAGLAVVGSTLLLAWALTGA